MFTSKSLTAMLRLSVCVACFMLASVVDLSQTPVLAQSTPAASPVAVDSIEITGLVLRPGPLSEADLQNLPAETVDVTFESGGNPQNHTFTGVRLIDILTYVGLDVASDAHHPLLPVYLVVTANDGYQIVVSGGEIDPGFGNVPMLLAWEQDGAPLEGDQGPLRLVVPGDTHGGRYVHGIVSIDVRTVASE